ncbi:DUF4123 domain-containing protein [Photorhabdus namnaonensis]|uniref:DUF4123 domain-containing protein n=1 Tax=Photorhabdus namnaonensis TaxID=1851568 RepID=A0A1B8YKT8_9GAMM|nr:DUF4123 domain-containing protein [Photorhabdus namnaonensis]OCA55679.1 hypothetical protein Phpb_01226 [Photorhabdus namnaonensis]OCA55827.1 hypothetical protein Phpb_01070 [Photorhabdus namnaonensis]
MAAEKYYVVIDGAIEYRLFFILENFNPPAVCLYDESLPPELLKAAPYLVEVTEKVGLYLEEWQTCWGICLHSKADMKTLRQHLRKYLQVLLPDQDKPVFFRFYDPRNIWEFLSVLSDWEIHCFLGPINKISTSLMGVKHEDNFHAARKQFPAEACSRQKMLRITTKQYAQLNELFEQRYINKLTRFINEVNYHNSAGTIDLPYDSLSAHSDRILKNPLPDTHYSPAYMDEATFIQHKTFAEDCFYFCRDNEITDERSIGGFLYLLMARHINQFEQIPPAWLTALRDPQWPGYYRMETLLKSELGFIPD